MAGWFISCHGVQPAQGTPLCKIPGRMKIYFYVTEGKSLSMDGGWKLWDVLMYGAKGGVATARREAIYVKDRTQDIYDYNFHQNPGETWPDPNAAHHAIDATGIFLVGNYSPPTAAPVNVGPNLPTNLSTIIKAAQGAGVDEIHVGTCRWSASMGQVVAPRWLT